MEKKYWFPAWVVLYVASVAFGVFWPESVVARIVGVLFFLPPAVLLWKGEEKMRRLIRIIAIVSLAATMVTIIAMFLSVHSEKNLDHLMDAILLLVAAPMKCFKAWVVSLFGWACLLYGSFVEKKL